MKVIPMQDNESDDGFFDVGEEALIPKSKYVPDPDPDPVLAPLVHVNADPQELSDAIITTPVFSNLGKMDILALQLLNRNDNSSTNEIMDAMSEDLFISISLQPNTRSPSYSEGYDVNCTLVDVHISLADYYNRHITIHSLSGKKLDIEKCYINLAIVEGYHQRQRDQAQLKSQAQSFVRMESYEKVNGAKLETTIPIEDLFKRQILPGGKEDIPKRILIQGRAGIGKTSLCKRLVHHFLNGKWNDRFSAIIWIPLRQLKYLNSRNLEDYIKETYFAQIPSDRKGSLTRLLLDEVQSGKVLFILDGLDEIVYTSQTDAIIESFLTELLRQTHIIITSRPSGVDVDGVMLPVFDLELETVGFCRSNVRDYVNYVLDAKSAKSVLDYIQRTPIIQSITNIPIQLDVICFSWEALLKCKDTITTTGLYRRMINRLWVHDMVRLKKSDISQAQQNNIAECRIIYEMGLEMEFLCCLAFQGIRDNRIEFDNDTLEEFYISLDAGQCRFPISFLDTVKQSSFLNTADANLDSHFDLSKQSWHFIHLTFQEYFAALWLASHFPTSQVYLKIKHAILTWEEVKSIIKRNKYDPRYEVVWWMLAGLLDEESLVLFFKILRSDCSKDLVGSQHALILSRGFNESSHKMNRQLMVDLEEEITRIIHRDITISRGVFDDGRLGERQSIPEKILVRHCFTTEKEMEYTLRALQCRRFKSDETALHLINLFNGFEGKWRRRIVRALGSLSSLPDQVIDFLVNALKFQDYDIRSSATDILIEQPTLGCTAVQSLVDLLQDKSPFVGESAAKILLSKPSFSPDALQPLIVALNDDDPFVALVAVEVLGIQSTMTSLAIHGLIYALYDYNRDVKTLAGEILIKQSTLPLPIISILIDSLNKGELYVKRIAMKTLGGQESLSPEVTKALIKALRDDTDEIRILAAQVLIDRPQFSPSDVQCLLQAFDVGIPFVMSSVVKALVGQRELPQLAINHFMDGLKSPNIKKREISAEVLGSQPSLPYPAIQALAFVLADTSDVVRSKAAIALRGRENLSSVTIQKLADALTDESDIVRSSILKALSNQQGLPLKVVQSILDRLKDKCSSVALAAADTLGCLTPLPMSIAESLIKCLKDNNKSLKELAERVLVSHSALPHQAVRILVDIIKGESQYVSVAANLSASIELLSSSDSQSDVELIRGDDENLVSIAVKVLSNQSKLDSTEIFALIETLKDESPCIRQAATQVLKSKALPQSVLQSLIDLLKGESSNLKSIAAEILGSQSSLPCSAVQALIHSLNDPSDNVKHSATKALENQSALQPDAIQSLIDVLKGSPSIVKRLVIELLNSQPKLPSSAIQALVDSLRDDDPDVSHLADEVLGNQTTLSSSAILPLIDALKDDNEGVRSSAADRLRRQSLLPDHAIQRLIDTLKDGNKDTRLLVAQALGCQETLPISAIKPIMESLRDVFYLYTESSDKRYMTGQSVMPIEALLALFGVVGYERKDVQEVCKAIPSMPIHEIENLIEVCLFQYCCRRNMALFIDENRLCYYSEEGVYRSEPLDIECVDKIKKAFDSSNREEI